MTNEEYVSMLQLIIVSGVQMPRRGMLSRELTTCTNWDMKDPVVTIPERKLNYAFMFAEALWILRGHSNLSDIAPFCKNYGNYSDDGRHLSGAYGPMYASQQRYVVDTLIKDIFTRQAVMTFWRPNPRESSDIPCTISMQFLITSFMKLDIIVNMRSSDAFMGLPYDVFSFSMMAYHTLLELRNRGTCLIELGVLTINSACQHIYERDVERCQEVLDSHGNRKYKTLISPSIISPVALEMVLEAYRDNPEALWTE